MRRVLDIILNNKRWIIVFIALIVFFAILEDVFEEEIFSTCEMLYDTIIPLATDQDEKVQLEVAKTMALVENEASTNWLLTAALFDRFDSVRYEALLSFSCSKIC